ncbi:hypothetical protein UT300012_22300 [Paraclostridium bifermentans]
MLNERRIVKIDNRIRRKYLNSVERKLFIIGGLATVVLGTIASLGYSIYDGKATFDLKLILNSLETGVSFGLLVGVCLAIGHNIFRQQIRTQFADTDSYVDFENKTLEDMLDKGTIDDEEYDYFLDLRDR